MEALLTHQQINAKFRLGLGTLLGVLIVAATMSMVALLHPKDADEDFMQRVSVVALARGLDRDFGDLRRNVEDFASTGHRDSVDRATKIAAIIRTTIAKGFAEIHDPERRERMKDVSEEFETYMTAFTALVSELRGEGQGFAANARITDRIVPRLSRAAQSVEENVVWIRDSGAEK